VNLTERASLTVQWRWSSPLRAQPATRRYRTPRHCTGQRDCGLCEDEPSEGGLGTRIVLNCQQKRTSFLFISARYNRNQLIVFVLSPWVIISYKFSSSVSSTWYEQIISVVFCVVLTSQVLIQRSQFEPWMQSLDQHLKLH